MRRLAPGSLARVVVLVMLGSVVPASHPATIAGAQTTSGSLSGQVLDPSGKRLMTGVKVSVVDELNGNTRATITDETGWYRIPYLFPGLYTVTVSAPGYGHNSFRHVRIQLTKMEVILPPIRLLPLSPEPASLPQNPSGQVPGVESLVNTTDATRGGNFSDRQVESLPLGGTSEMRTYDDYALLVVGVVLPPFTPGVRGPGVGFGIGTAGQFSVNGARARSNNFTVDGSDNNDPDVGVRRQAFLALVPQSIESIKEFQVSTLLWDSEAGRNLGSQVNVVSKLGGNEFRGQAYGFFTDSAMNARNFFDQVGGVSDGENPFTRTQAGFVLGGPALRGRTQIFGSLEHHELQASTEQHFSTPKFAERDFRVFLGHVLQTRRQRAFSVLKPFLNADPEVSFGTTLGATPLGLNILSFYPLPNNPLGPYGENTYTEILPADGGGDVFSVRATHQVTKDSSLNSRYNFTGDNRTLSSINRAIRSTIDSSTLAQNLSLVFDSALSPTLFNQARFSYGRTRLRFPAHPDGRFEFQSAFTAIVNEELKHDSLTGPIGELVIEPFSPVGIDAFTFPQGRANNTFQLANSTSWKRENHSFKFGADIRRYQLNSFQDRNYRPKVVYGNGVVLLGNRVQEDPSKPFRFKPSVGRSLLPGVALATVGLPSSIFQTIASVSPDSHSGLRYTEYNFLFNDNWRVSSNLTVDYGLRYEYNTVPHEVNSRIEDAITLRGLPTPGSSVFDTPDRTAAFSAAVNAYRQVLGGRTGIYDPDRNNFGPHIGFAWGPRASGRTVVRGGYGVYYDAILGAVVSQSRNVFPTEISINIDTTFLSFDVFRLANPAFMRIFEPREVSLIRSGTINQFGGPPEDFVALVGQTLLQNQKGGGLAFTLPEKDLRTPHAQQWHLTIEREIADDYLISAAYVGTKGTKLTRLTTPNLGPNLTLSVPVALGQGAPGTIIPYPPKIIGPTVLAESATSIRRDRPIPQLGAYQVFENSADSVYHALQLESRKRYNRGYQFTAAYTWSHALDDVSDVFPIAGAPIIAQDSFNLRAERGDANFDVRHRFSGSLIWDVLSHRNWSTAVERWLGGWQIATVIQAQTGQPFTLNVPVDANFDGNLTDRPSTTYGLLFLEGHGPRKVVLAPDRNLSEFFVFGQNGFVGRNTGRGDTFINFDLALTKSIRFRENQMLRIRTEFFNLFDRANFGLPIRTIGAPAFGSAVDTVNPARIIQFAVKYSF